MLLREKKTGGADSPGREPGGQRLKGRAPSSSCLVQSQTSCLNANGPGGGFKSLHKPREGGTGETSPGLRVGKGGVPGSPAGAQGLAVDVLWGVASQLPSTPPHLPAFSGMAECHHGAAPGRNWFPHTYGTASQVLTVIFLVFLAQDLSCLNTQAPNEYTSVLPIITLLRRRLLNNSESHL